MADRPNVLLITTHDTGRHFGCYGVPTLSTPAIDRLADQGVRLSNYFTAVPICAASRVSMLTGHYPQTHGMYDLPLWGDEFHDGIRHLSHHLRDAGYQTALMGQHHETADDKRLAFDRMEAWRKSAIEVAEATRSYLQSVDRDKPFYLQVGFVETHSPFDRGGRIEPDHSRGVFVPPYIKPTGPAYELLAKLQGAIRQADQAVGMIEEVLREAGLAENTLLIFTTDHGVELRRAKWTLYDAGLEIGLVARWPGGGIEGGRVCDALASNVDFTPTVLELLGLPGGEALAGRSMADLWRGRSRQPIHEHIFGYYSKTDSRCIRTLDEKLMIQGVLGAATPPPVDLADPSGNSPAAPVSLFDLTNDPLESRNLVDDPAYAQRRDHLLDQLWRWMEDLDDPLLKGPTTSPRYEQALAPYAEWKRSGAPAAAR